MLALFTAALAGASAAKSSGLLGGIGSIFGGDFVPRSDTGKAIRIRLKVLSHFPRETQRAVRDQFRSQGRRNFKRAVLAVTGISSELFRQFAGRTAREMGLPPVNPFLPGVAGPASGELVRFPSLGFPAFPNALASGGFPTFPSAGFAPASFGGSNVSLFSQFLPAPTTQAGFPTLGDVGRTIFGGGVLEAINPFGFFTDDPDVDDSGLPMGTGVEACPPLFRRSVTQFADGTTRANVSPLRQLHAINPRTGNQETWLHAGRPTAWSRVSVKRPRPRHH
ncbi:MAG: hypothetical protein V3T00_09795, partial [bacterium]